MPGESVETVLTVFDAGAAPADPTGLQTFVLMGGILLIMWFLMIRPQQQERKKHDALVESLKKGDQVILQSGIHGKIWAVQEATVVLVIADKTRITVEKNAVVNRPTDAPTEKK